MAAHIVGTFTITVKGDSPDTLTVEASSPDKIRVPPQLLRLPFEQLNTIDALSRAQSHVSDATLKTIGQALYTAVFTPSILSALANARAKTKANEGIRIRFVIGSASLLNWPWELMHDGESLIATQGDSPFVRSLPQSQEIHLIKQLQVRSALRILFVGASPCDLDPLRIENAAEELKQLLAEPLRKKQLVLEMLLNPTLSELRDKVLENFHILYFAGHGTATEIFLDDGQGEIDEKTGQRSAGYSYPISAQMLGPLLKDKPIRLVFLAACNTASSGSDPLGGFAYNLMRTANIPAIVAMQYYISDYAANELTGRFLKAIAAFQPVDVALAEARKALVIQGKMNRDTVAPIMYLHAQDSALFRPAINWSARGLAVSLLMLMSLVLVVIGVLRFYWEFSTQKAGNDFSQQARTLFDEGEPRQGLLMAVAGYDLNPTTETLAQLNTLVEKVDDHLIRYLYPIPQSNPALQDEITSTITLATNPTSSALAWSDGEQVTLWTPDTTLSQKFEGLKNVTSLTFDTTGHYLAGGSSEGDIIVWNAATGAILWGPVHYWNHSERINDLAFSPDGTHLAAASCAFMLDDAHCTQGLVMVWDTEVMTQHHADANSNPVAEEWLLGPNAVTHVAFSPDGQWLAALSSGVTESETVYLWNLVSQEKRTLTLESNPRAPIGLTFTSDSKALAVGLGNKLIVWNTHDDISQSISIGHNITVLTPGPEGSTVIVADNQQQLTLWNAITQSRIGPPLIGHQQPIGFLSVTQNGQTLLSVGMQAQKPSEFILWSLNNTGRQRLVLDKLTEPLYDFVVNVKSGWWSAVGADGKLIHRSIANAQGDQVLLSLPDAVKGISISSDLTQVVLYYHDGKTQYPLVARRINLNTGTSMEKQSTRDIDFSVFTPFRRNTAFDPDGRYVGLVDASYPGIGFWNLANNNIPNSSNTTSYFGINTVVFGPKRSPSSDVPWTATGSQNGQVVFWDPKTGTPMDDPVAHHSTEITSLAFSPNGQWLASGSLDGKIRLQNLQTNTLVEPLLVAPKSTSQISALAFSADSHLLASGNTNGQIVVWDLEQTPPHIISTLSTDGQPIRIAVLDSSALIVGNTDGSIVRWLPEPVGLETSSSNPITTLNDPVTKACSIVNQPMTSTERAAQIAPALNDIFLSQFLSTSVKEETPCASTQSN